MHCGLFSYVELLGTRFIWPVTLLSKEDPQETLMAFVNVFAVLYSCLHKHSYACKLSLLGHSIFQFSSSS